MNFYLWVHRKCNKGWVPGRNLAQTVQVLYITQEKQSLLPALWKYNLPAFVGFWNQSLQTLIIFDVWIYEEAWLCVYGTNLARTWCSRMVTCPFCSATYRHNLHVPLQKSIYKTTQHSAAKFQIFLWSKINILLGWKGPICQGRPRISWMIELWQNRQIKRLN